MNKIYKVIIADDEVHIRRGLFYMIGAFRLPLRIVGEAKNGLEALQMSNVLDPDILVLDICMPKMSGLDLLEKLRVVNQEMKIIIISGFNEFEYARKAISYHVTAYLLKPVKEAELYNALETCIFGDRRQSEKNEAEDLFLSDLVRKCLQCLRTEYTDQNFDLGKVAERLAINPDHLSRKLKLETGKSFKEWLSDLRIKKAMELLQENKYTVYEIADLVGYSNQHYFSTAFKNKTGYSPTGFSKSLNGEERG